MTPWLHRLERRWTDRHLTEFDLWDLVLAEDAGTPGPGLARARTHQLGCRRCSERVDACRGVLFPAGPVPGAGGEWTEERLAAQRRAILDRLDTARMAARVLPFPRRIATGTPVSVPSAMRMAMTAAVGIVVGLGVGMVLDLGHGAVDQAPMAGAVRMADAGTSPALSDERLLDEMEAALADWRGPALRALDEMTPRVDDAAFVVPE